jgi:hypothetical protein
MAGAEPEGFAGAVCVGWAAARWADGGGAFWAGTTDPAWVGAGMGIVSVGSLGGVDSAHKSPTERKTSAPTPGNHIGVLGSGSGGGPW